MKKVMIIGCCGAGKSTFSRKLHDIIKLELIHLDKEYWKPNWTQTPKPIWRQKVRKLAAKPSWIIDGNYGSTMDIRMEKADTIIFLDYSTTVCLWRVISRAFKNRGKTRPDINSQCREKLDWEFLKFVATFRQKKAPEIRAKLAAYEGEKNIFVFRNDNDANFFLENLRKEK